MKIHPFIVCFLLSLFLSTASSHAQRSSHKVYIVYFGEHGGEKTTQEIEDTHHSYLQAVKGSIHEAKASLLYSYKNIINGFAALLAPEEADKLSEMDEVISVFESKGHTTRTTRSWDFVGMLEGGGNKRKELLEKANYGKDVIVGVLDSGVWPESKSFNDEGMEPIPASWKGVCQKGVAFDSSLCNRKLIGARYYLKGYEAEFGHIEKNSFEYASARDKNGHGTHTASTVAGRAVRNAATHGGFARGTATGGVPLARIAVYKVCWTVTDSGSTTCLDADILAAFDDAVSDGVHVISISIGPNGPSPYFSDGIQTGALHAAKKNILVSASAGNEGPKTVSNVAPWIITVAASSTDRQISSAVILGNGLKFPGESVTPFSTTKSHRLVFAADAEIPVKTKPPTSGQCHSGTLSPVLVKGKTVICGASSGGTEVKRAGGAAVIMMNGVYGNLIRLDDSETEIPSTIVTINDTIKIIKYTRTQKNPTSALIRSHATFGNSAPIISSFSSTGPNGIEPNILKPDITAPGVNILAAWTEGIPIPDFPGNQRAEYNIASGTSMSCPHVSAVAALLKAIHPKWSGAAIKSAIMTTATTNNNKGKPIEYSDGSNANSFQYGAGHIQPLKAIDPGLVYDASYYDYHLFLCASNISKIKNCPKNPPTQSNLNYPSVAITSIKRMATVTRTVTNVAGNKALYNSTIHSPHGFNVKIYPPTLKFNGIVGEKKRFSITVTKMTTTTTTTTKMSTDYAFGSFAWSDGIHQVRSPIVVS